MAWLKKLVNDIGKVLVIGSYYILVIYFLLFFPYSDTIVSYSDVFLLIFAIGKVKEIKKCIQSFGMCFK